MLGILDEVLTMHMIYMTATIVQYQKMVAVGINSETIADGMRKASTV